MLCDDYEAATGKSISGAAIEKHFKNLGIPRDLSAKIQAKADAIVGASMVCGKVGNETSPTDAQIVNASADKVAAVLLSHRSDFERMRQRAAKYEAELELCGEDLMKRATILKSLAETTVKLADAERKAFGMDKEQQQTDNPLKSLLQAIAGSVIGPRNV